MAADLDIQAGRMTEVLIEHVHKHISILGEPEFNLAEVERLELSIRKGWTLPRRISVPQWADDYRKLVKEAGSTSGNWETSTVEIVLRPMLAATESGVHIITVMCCTHLMKTAQLEKFFGYFAHLEPSPIRCYSRKKAAEQFSK